MKAKQFLTGAEVVVQAAIDAGATMMYGYPITPGTEILSHWIRTAQDDKSLKYLQTEDEIAAGFCMCGAVMAGEKTFTATAGPGTVLMQDALSMADGMRLPLVVVVVQRGGPSSGTVIYSQQEVNLAIHGGNGEGLRLVYSPSNLTELYEYTRLAFNNAWKYNFPAIVLSDGFLMKTRQLVDLDFKIKNFSVEPIISENTQKNIRNIYTFEEELGEKLEKDKIDFIRMAEEVAKSEFVGKMEHGTGNIEQLIVAHGIVAGAAKEAVDELQKAGKKVGLFRPITLSPFPAKELNEIVLRQAQDKLIKKIWVVESSMGQLRDLVKQNLEVGVEVGGLYKPAEGIESEEIVKLFI